MAVTVAATAVVLGSRYFSRCGSPTAAEGAGLGLLWLAMCVAIDLPLMLGPPLHYSPTEYCADIGLTYGMMPIITLGIALAANRAGRTSQPA
jgi:hypothetical protein